MTWEDTELQEEWESIMAVVMEPDVVERWKVAMTAIRRAWRAILEIGYKVWLTVRAVLDEIVIIIRRWILFGYLIHWGAPVRAAGAVASIWPTGWLPGLDGY